MGDSSRCIEETARDLELRLSKSVEVEGAAAAAV